MSMMVLAGGFFQDEISITIMLFIHAMSSAFMDVVVDALMVT
jgi:hypothetical protein